jgi:hypothetical protein
MFHAARDVAGQLTSTPTPRLPRALTRAIGATAARPPGDWDADKVLNLWAMVSASALAEARGWLANEPLQGTMVAYALKDWSFITVHAPPVLCDDLVAAVTNGLYQHMFDGQRYWAIMRGMMMDKDGCHLCWHLPVESSGMKLVICQWPWPPHWATAPLPAGWVPPPPHQPHNAAAADGHQAGALPFNTAAAAGQRAAGTA